MYAQERQQHIARQARTAGRVEVVALAQELGVTTETVRRDVLAIYAEADAAVAAAGPRCDASGRCCRFTEYGHTLFISHFEAEILLESAPPFARPVSRDGCPFQVGGLCTAREARPLGCRIYFCDPAYESRMSEITEAAVAGLKAVADDESKDDTERLIARLKMAEIPRNANPTRVRNRCEVTGRPRAYYRKFRLSRVMLRELANKGLIPGVTKSSW